MDRRQVWLSPDDHCDWIMINSKATQQSVPLIYSVSSVQGDAGQPGVPGESVGGVCLLLNTYQLRVVVSTWLNEQGLVFVCLSGFTRK